MSVKLLFSTRRGIFSRAVRFITWSKYSHVDMIVGNKVIGASAMNGVEMISLDDRLDAAYRWVIYEVPMQMINDPDDVYRIISSQIGKPYDYTGILGFLFHRDWQKEEHWFCSELIAWAFCKAGINLLSDRVRKSRIAPEHLLMSPIINKLESSDEQT